MSSEHTKMIRKIFHLTEVQVKKLHQLSIETGLSLAEHVRRAIDLYLKSVEK